MFVTVDMVVLTIADDELSVLLIEPGAEPYLGSWALPGGFTRPDEDLDDAAARGLEEETAVRAAKHFEQLGAYGTPNSDPRSRIVTVTYLPILPEIGLVRADTDARRAEVVPVSSVPSTPSRAPYREAKTSMSSSGVATTAVLSLEGQAAHARSWARRRSVATTSQYGTASAKASMSK